MNRGYTYLPFRYVRHGIWTALRVLHFRSLADARSFARHYAAEHNLPTWSFFILRYHPFCGYEEKQYSI